MSWLDCDTAQEILFCAEIQDLDHGGLS